jgi:Transposase DDE domain
MGQINEENLLGQWHLLKEKYFTDLSDLPSDCFFTKLKDSKIQLDSFVLGFVMMLIKGGNSLNQWTMQTGGIGSYLLSKQGLSKKLSMPIAYFMKQLLLLVLRKSLQEATNLPDGKSALLCSFTNVYLEDSTCISMPDNLSVYFKSSYSRLKESATARLQVCMNLKSHHLADITLQSYRDNDQKHASSIVSILKKGDLVIRDLGYSVLAAFSAIVSVMAFFLSRLRSDVQVYLISDTEKPLDLYQYLLENDKKGQYQVDLLVLLGKKEKLTARFVALKLPQAVADERRRKANLNRDKRLKPSSASMYLLGWAIFVTNVSIDIWQPTDLAKVYRMRWRIEIIFKTWKSHFNFSHIFQTTGMTYPRALISFYLLLLFLTLFFVRWFDYFFYKIVENTANDPRWLSIFKFADYVKLFFQEFLTAFSENELCPLLKRVQYYCCYDKRIRLNEAQVLHYYFFG